MTKRVLFATLGVGVIALIAVGLARHFQTMPAGAAATALQRRLRVPYDFRCHHIQNDGTIALANVTYQCDAAAMETHPQRTSYWVSTNRDHITGMQPMG